MDQEMNFPNPVVRTDLPTRRRRWPRMLVAALVFGALVIVFLPQILSSKPGRKLVVSYLSAKTNGPVTLGSFKTSWFGGTSAHFLSMPDPMNRTIGFKSLKCQASLWNLLRGNYKLGDTTIEGLNVEYVVDDGRGGSTWDRFRDPDAPSALPNVSGKITINRGTIVLHRGTVQPGLYDTTWEQGRLVNVEATFDVQGLDRPWTYTATADTMEGDDARGSLSSSGTVDLGENGQADGRQAKLDLVVSGENVHTGGLGAALIPAATPADVRHALGNMLAKVEIAVKAADGRVAFERCEGSGATTTIEAKPVFDMTATPTVLTLTEPGVIKFGVSKRLAAGGLAYFNPFFREAVGGQGSVTLTLDQLSLPLGRQWAKAATAKGRIDARGVILERKDEMTTTQISPDNLASQLALLTGDGEKAVPLAVAGTFTVAGGDVIVAPSRTVVGETTLSIEGTAGLADDALKQSATVVSSPAVTSVIKTSGGAGFAIPIGGTIRQPLLGVLNLKGDLSDASLKAINEQVNQQITRMRAKETQRLMQKSQDQVKDLLRPLQDPDEKRK